MPLDNQVIELLNARLGDMKDSMEQGFRGVHSRLDKLNGRVAEGEQEITKIKTVGKTISVIYGILVTLVGLSGGCVWLQKSAPASIFHGGNSAVGMEQLTR